jgi:hypothetical protein
MGAKVDWCWFFQGVAVMKHTVTVGLAIANRGFFLGPKRNGKHKEGNSRLELPSLD